MSWALELGISMSLLAAIAYGFWFLLGSLQGYYILLDLHHLTKHKVPTFASST